MPVVFTRIELVLIKINGLPFNFILHAFYTPLSRCFPLEVILQITNKKPIGGYTMNKKIIAIVLIILLATAVFVGTASANQLQPDDTGRNSHLTIGQIVELSENHFIINKPDGDQITVEVTENTCFHSRAEDQGVGFDDLSVGIWVAVAGQPDEVGKIIARLVVLLPEDFDPEAVRGRRVSGEVTHINNGQDTFTIAIRSGDEITFDVDDSTRYLNGLGELKDLEKGMKVGVLAVAQQEGNPLAKVVVAVELDPNYSRERLAGKVDTVSPESLTLIVRGGGAQSFAVMADTQFRSLDGSIEDIQDLESGHVVVVIFEGDETTGYTALGVISTGEALNQAINNLQRAGGEVQSAGGSHLTILTESGERMDFIVGENIHVRGINGEADLNDLKNGMRVMVLYNTDEDGNLVARVIFFGERDNAPS
jgi:hypothetical protein